MKGDESMKVGDKIKSLRVRDHLTQQELAEKLGIKQNTVSDYERNRLGVSLKFLKEIANIFQVEFNYFFDEMTIEENFSDTDDYSFILNIIKTIIEDEKVNSPDDISKEMMSIIEAATKETVRRVKGKREIIMFMNNGDPAI